jgi:hypothetical protein
MTERDSDFPNEEEAARLGQRAAIPAGYYPEWP